MESDASPTLNDLTQNLLSKSCPNNVNDLKP